jgi:hypothetical protein
MINTPDEQLLTLCDQANLKARVLKKITCPKNTVHTNRDIDTGWQVLRFDFTVTDEFFLKGVLCRVIRKSSDIELLQMLLRQVESLIASGITDLKIIFSIDLYLNYPPALKNEILALTKTFPFIEKTHFIKLP